MSHLRNTLLVSVLLGSLISCHKSEEDPQPAANISANNTSHSMAQFQLAHRSPTQVFTVDAGQLIHVVGAQGIMIDLPANSIFYMGQPVTGNVEIELIEVFHKSDMILHEKPTTCINGELLLSQGEFSVQIKQDNHLLDAYPVMSVPVKANNAPNPTSMFGGRTFGNNPDFAPEFSWGLNYTQGSPGTVDTVYFTSIGEKRFYQMSVDFGYLNWWNCDVFWNNTSPRSTLAGTWSSPAATEPTVFVSVDGYPSVGRLYPDGHTYSTKGKATEIKLPDNLSATVISFQFENDKFYFGKKTVTTGPGISPQLQLKEISEADLVKELDALQ